MGIEGKALTICRRARSAGGTGEQAQSRRRQDAQLLFETHQRAHSSSRQGGTAGFVNGASRN